jgi:hypothetical protein
LSTLQQIRNKLRDRTKAATTLGFGPRFLQLRIDLGRDTGPGLRQLQEIRGD